MRRLRVACKPNRLPKIISVAGPHKFSSKEMPYVGTKVPVLACIFRKLSFGKVEGDPVARTHALQLVTFPSWGGRIIWVPTWHQGDQETMLMMGEKVKSQETWQQERVPYSTNMSLPPPSLHPHGFYNGHERMINIDSEHRDADIFLVSVHTLICSLVTCQMIIVVTRSDRHLHPTNPIFSKCLPKKKWVDASLLAGPTELTLTPYNVLLLQKGRAAIPSTWSLLLLPEGQ
ncbi:hypothetical protein AAES_164417 [Amazona aestiva]|uniref:Uncharacterized protein n=1 Tax=Amazona aestiva TaxID=12930 RepID=A0A0Q3LTY5_AMAAE|nr:hypothetical protein AAES_164417 [Amazona aestiva]